MSRVSRRGLFGLLAGAAVTPLLSRLPAASPTITQELRHAATGMFVRYTGYEVLNITPSDVLFAADYDWEALPALR